MKVMQKFVSSFACLLVVSLTASAAGVLPEDCLALEYIETTTTGVAGNAGQGDQYILLNYTPTSNSVVEAEVAMLAKDYNQSIFCARGAKNNENAFSLFWIGIGSDPNKGLRYDYDTAMQYSGFGAIEKDKSTCFSAHLADSR